MEEIMIDMLRILENYDINGVYNLQKAHYHS
ncbi:hypothetical protein Fokcrypt_00132 [Candidatus Fokinia cryptica]|uniref:Uncharacterized protein n=1 Tax=Candidatus Fokinia crypta TaxID=1920990 RepID=A0ABZ0UU88_9RICK|nr:hypothetical protein Fokcrypt_00132 [Candidatus Fokinia cryptica]